MAKEPTITTITSGYYSRQALNNNFESLRDGFDNTISRDGSTPNTMLADLDMNSNDILNAGSVDTARLLINGDAVSSSDLVLSALAIAQQYDTVTNLLAASDTYSAGAYVQTVEGDYYYKAVASGGDVTNAGGQQFEVLPVRGTVYLPEQWKENTTPGTTDMTAAIQAANDKAYSGGSQGKGLELIGTYYTTSTITFTARMILFNDVIIRKALDDTEVVRFKGRADSTDSSLRSVLGHIRAEQDAKPSSLQTSAHAFVFDDVIHCTFESLDTGNCAYCYVNDETSDHGLCWGNFWKHMKGRGCVQGFMKWDFPGSGAHTENFVGVGYFNGKENGDPALLPKEDVPFNFNNAEGFAFGTLNIEWTEIASGASANGWIRLQNGTTFSVQNMHFEGNELASGDQGIFWINNAGTVRTNVWLGNLHINNFTQTGGTLSLVWATTVSHGKVRIENLSGTYTANTFTDFRALDADGDGLVLDLGAANGWENFLTAERKGGVPTSYLPNIYLDNVPYELANIITNPGTTIDIGAACEMRLSGTPAGTITQIDVAVTRAKERLRTVMIENNTGGNVLFGGGGNLNAPSGMSFPLTLPANRVLLAVARSQTNKLEIIGFSA